MARSLRAGINAMCRQCTYDPRAAGHWRTQVELCTAVDCALWELRPLRTERLAYSQAVVDELGMSAETAAYRSQNPLDPAWPGAPPRRGVEGANMGLPDPAGGEDEDELEEHLEGQGEGEPGGSTLQKG